MKKKWFKGIYEILEAREGGWLSYNQQRESLSTKLGYMVGEEIRYQSGCSAP